MGEKKQTKSNSKNSEGLLIEQKAENSTSAELERERLLSLINSMADGVVAVDEKGKIALYNGAALNVLDVNTSLAGKKIDSVAKIIDINNQPVDFTSMVTSTVIQSTSRDLKISYPDGSVSNLYTSIAPVRLGFGKNGNKGFVILLRDITREKSLEEERDEFISVVSHELRTPIAIAEGNISNAQFIAEKQKSSKQIQETLTIAHEQVVFLAGMINDLATLSRAERGVLKVEAEPINTHELIEDLVKTYKPDASAKNLTIKTSLDPKLELLISSKLYVREILQNFITNAIKYTEEGGITIGAKQVASGVTFQISDTGIGISKTDQERVFDKFFRSEDYRTRANNGTGLGLYVTMKLARIVHAEISLESVLDKGSTFSIYVPNYGEDSSSDVKNSTTKQPSIV